MIKESQGYTTFNKNLKVLYESITLLGNGNKGISKVDKRVKDLEQLNKNLVSELDKTNEKLENISKVLLKLFAKSYEIDDLDDLNGLKIETSYIEGKTESEIKDINEKENEIINYILKIKKDLE